MRLLTPTLPDYDPLEWARMPFGRRAKLVCVAWAEQGYGTPAAIFGVYALKIVAFVAGWVGWCSLSPSLGGPAELSRWWLEPLAFQKAIVWSMLFEVLGLGCGSGPLGGRYLPPISAPLYFLRPRTMKLSLFPGAPLVGADRRGWWEVGLYAGLLAALGYALLAPTLGARELLPALALLGALSVSDKSVFLAARGEHYAVTMLVFALASGAREWIAGAMVVQAALWFFAGFSKLNRHFPAVVGVMMSNSPVWFPKRLRRRMYRSFPDDLRPSRLARWLGHGGTALELAVPLVLLSAGDGPLLLVGMGLMIALHLFITSNVPMGVPLEWNVLVVYGAFALFWAHPDVDLHEMSAPVAVVVVVASVLIPLAGNLWPSKFSFLPSMRYYAGNWAMSVWLFRKESYRKLAAQIPMSSPWVEDQLARLYDEPTRVGLLGKVMAFRLMHLHGRVIGMVLDRMLTVPDAGGTRRAELDEYTWVDGELVAGWVLGWNFGDGHLHDERLLAAITRACAFEPGELRCLFVESQPLGGASLHARVHDAHDGELFEAHVPVGDLLARQPWDLDAPPRGIGSSALAHRE